MPGMNAEEGSEQGAEGSRQTRAEFAPAHIFRGPKHGMFFGRAVKGPGYYTDTPKVMSICKGLGLVKRGPPLILCLHRRTRDRGPDRKGGREG